MPCAKIITFPLAAARIEPSRAADEAFLEFLDENRSRVSYNEAGEPFVTVGDAPTREDGVQLACALSASRDAPSSPNPFVSPYLLNPLRSEAEARAARVPKARGLWEALRDMVRQ